MTVGFLIQVLILIAGTFVLGGFTAWYLILKSKNGLIFLWHRDKVRLARISDLTRQLARTVEDRDAKQFVIDEQRRELVRLRIAVTNPHNQPPDPIDIGPLAPVHHLPLPVLAVSEGAAL